MPEHNGLVAARTKAFANAANRTSINCEHTHLRSEPMIAGPLRGGRLKARAA
jgi:hypothetical protein